jgi:hypothetical protein
MNLPRPLRARWSHVVPGVVAACVVTALAACVVETEPAPKRPLLRDVMAAQAAHADASAAASAPVPVPSAAPSVSVAEPLTVGFDAPPVPDSFRTCQADSDCVAVLRNGCCHDGRNEAMNKSSVDAYKSSFTCPEPKPRCPMHLVLDRREPACDATTHTCKLREPAAAP